MGPEQDRLAEAIRQHTALPDPVCRVLARRGVAPEDTAGFLTPTLRDSLPEDAGRFFAEGMEQIAVIDYPDQVREVETLAAEEQQLTGALAESGRLREDSTTRRDDLRRRVEDAELRRDEARRCSVEQPCRIEGARAPPQRRRSAGTITGHDQPARIHASYRRHWHGCRVRHTARQSICARHPMRPGRDQPERLP